MIEQFIWLKDAPSREMYQELGARLAEEEDMFVLDHQRVLTVADRERQTVKNITSATKLDAAVKDRLDARTDQGKDIPKRELTAMLHSNAFLEQFRALDKVTTAPLFREDFTPAQPGYNAGDEGFRLLYFGDAVDSAEELEFIPQFLDVMDFKEQADRANAVGLALTVLLRNHWPGAKPLGAILGNKSHAGKDTVRDFAAGRVPYREISWQGTDWPVEQASEKVLRDADVGILSVGNVRSNGQPISSAFLERFVTESEPMLNSTKISSARRRRNDVVVTITANQGRLSPDLLNRALVIRLETTGNVRDRNPEIGNPRHEFLPAHEEAIEAELALMIER